MTRGSPRTISGRPGRGFMRNYLLDSQLITTQLREGVRKVFAEDEAMLSAQQAAIDANPDHEFYSLNIDAYGSHVDVVLGADDNVTKASLMRPCSVTHTSDMDQRHLWLAIESMGGRSLRVSMPPTGALAPPGWYMLFLINEAGVPSQGHFFQLA